MTSHPREPKNEHGMALVTAMVTLLMVTVLGVALTSVGVVSVTVANNDRENVEALAIADAGITHAKALLLNQVWINGYDPLLVSGDGTACNLDEFATEPAGASSPYPPAGELIPAAGRAFPAGNAFGGRYEVRLCDDNALESTLPTPDANANHDVNGRLLARSRGIGRNGAETTIEAVFKDRALPALVVNGNLRINGNPSVMGSAGGIHANGDLDIDGTTACAEQYYEAVGTIEGDADGGPACVSGGAPALPGVDPLPIPKLEPSTFKAVADFLLVNLGAGHRIYCGPANTLAACAGSTLATPILYVANPPANPDTGWAIGNCAGTPCWKANGSILSATYYTDMNMLISGSPGSIASPVAVTLIAQGWVDISGNPSLRPKLMSPMTYAIVAGTDLEITGTLGTNAYEGLYYARDQINFSGDPEVSGLVVGGNFDDGKWPAGTGSNLVPRDADGYVSVSGNVLITYNGNAGWNALAIQAWRECRGPDPANPCGNP